MKKTIQEIISEFRICGSIDEMISALGPVYEVPSAILAAASDDRASKIGGERMRRQCLFERHEGVVVHVTEFVSGAIDICVSYDTK